MFTVNMVGHVFQQPHEVNEVKISGPEGFAGFMVLDTGCQRTCCGKVWSKAHINYLKEFGLHPNVIEFHDDFRFGKGAPSHSPTKAYYPSGIGEQPLLLAASILDERIPFLASNSLMTELGAVVSLVHDEVVFMRLQGAKAKIHRLGGHMAISITEFPDKALRNQHDVWKEFEKDVDWSQPPPEYILSSQSFSVSVPSLLQTLSDDPTTSEMAEGMAAADSAHQAPREGHDREHAPGGSSRVASTRSSTSTTTSPGVQGAPVPMCTHQVQEVRECTRKVCNVPSVQHQMDLEPGKESMGRQALGRGEEGSWIKRSLFALAAFASTFIGDNSELFNIGSNGSLSQPSLRTTCQSQEQNMVSKSSHGWPVDQLLRAELPHGAPHGRAVHGSLEHHGAGSSLRASSKELLRGGLLERGDLQAGAPEDAARSRFEEMGAPGGTGSGFNRGRRDLRLGASAGGSNTMKKGTAKRLKGEWMRSAKTLEAEHNIYLNQKTVKDRPPPSMDLWELFGGRALCSELAHQYDLNALQPWDLIYGYDFMRSSTRQEAAEALDRFKPLLLMLEIDCRHYTLFNKNLNYSSRLDEWEELQRQDRPLRTFTTSMARRQHESGRFFLIENPERSELWSMPDMVRLASLPGVYAFSLDAGAFGAFIDGNPVIKTFRLLTNLPDLDQKLQRRLSPEERAQCKPIEGAATRASQEYPEEMCRALLQHLREVARQATPSRFCDTHQALPVQMPTDDLQQWDEIVDNIEKSFENTTKRPYYITVDSAIGKKIQELLRLDAVRIQVVANPTTRRIPSNVDEYYTRASFLLYNDNTRTVEVEDLGELQYPRQRFLKPVRYAVFAYGHRRNMPETSTDVAPTLSSTTVPGLPTDIDFPGISSEIPSDIRSSVARLHLNMGHPSRQELCRLLAYEGSLPDAVYECAKKLRCATCERLRPKQPPRPSGKPSLVVGQFGDELQMDVFYCRTLTSTTFIVLGMVDKATGLQQAIVISDRSGDTVFEALEKAWLQPYGIPIHVSCDPDTSFRGHFQDRLTALGCLVEHCPAEAHWIIGMVERRNALLRTILEKLIDQFGATTVDECSTLLVAACHAINSSIHTHGRSAYQAVFGRQPRLVNSNFNDPMVLATSAPVADLNKENSAAYKAEFVRCEALKTLHQLDCSQHLRRALLRKTRTTKVADLQPGQSCAYWRWTRRGSKKRGAWKLGRFLSWDPSHVGKQAWLRTGGSTTLVTAEQLRAAFGFEDWTPSQEDVRALKDAAHRFDALLDDRGAPEDQAIDDDDIHQEADMEELNPEPYPMMPGNVVPQTPPELRGPAQPSTPPHQLPSVLQPQLPSLPPLQSQQTQVQQQQTITYNIESPTNITTNQMIQQQQYHRFGTPPRAPRRHRSRTPISQRIGGQSSEQQRQQPEQQGLLPPEQGLQQGEDTPLLVLDEQQAPTPTQQQQPVSQPAEGPSPVPPPDVQHQQPTIIDLATEEVDLNVEQDLLQEFPGEQALPAGPSAEVSQQQHFAVEDPYQQMLPQKRPFDTLYTLIADEFGNITRPHSHWDGSPWVGYGPNFKKFHHAYLSSQQRPQDVQDNGKDPQESDTTQGSDTENSEDEEKTNVPV